jgi:hypothetical protein
MAIPNQPDSNTFPLQSAQPGDSQLAVQRKEELTGYVKSFYRASWDWRSTRYHAQWDKFDRNYHSIYDPVNLGRKEPWQSHMFVGVTIQNVETITSQIFKTMMAPNPPIEIEAGPAGDDLQAKLMEEAEAYELRKAKFELAFYDSLKEAIRYGSGFMKLYWDRTVDTRKRKVLQTQAPSDFVNGLPTEALRGQVPMRYPAVQGMGVQAQQILLRNQLCAEYVHIRNLFPEPNTTDWSKFIHRQKMPYGWIMQNIKEGKFFDVSQDLEGVTEGERFDDDMRTSKADRKFIDLTRIWSKYEKRHTIWELWAPIPMKWINFDMPDGPDAEVLVPGKVMVASGGWLLSSEENPFFDGFSPVLKMDYIRTGESYGKGVPEMILDEQDEINEIRNQRVDNVNLIMNKMIAIFEKAIVNRKDLISQPGGVLRLKDHVMGQDPDIRKVVMPLDFPDVSQSSFRETLEIERQIQERTGASRVTLGSSNSIRDTNQTLGGMELLKQMFNERVAAYGMIIESQFLLEAAERIYSLIYQYLTPDDMRPILGEAPVEIDQNPMTGMPIEIPRYLAFAFVPPEEVSRSYRFKPMGIFSADNKIVKSAQVMDAIKLGAGMPPNPLTGKIFDPLSALEYNLTKLQGISEAEKWFKRLPPMPMMPPGMPPPGMTPGPNGAPLPPNNQIPAPNQAGTPGMKGGPNGNQPSFLPPNPIRRQPIV